MSSVASLLTLIGSLLISHLALASGFPSSSIRQICERPRSIKASNPLGVKVEKLMKDFADKGTRFEKTDELIQRMDEVLSLTPYQVLPKCKAKLNAESSKLRLKMRYVAPNKTGTESMGLAPDLDFTGDVATGQVEFIFDPGLSVPQLLLVYGHEMVHVCQMSYLAEVERQAQKSRSELNWMQWWAGVTGKHERLQAYYEQLQFLAEIDAFYQMSRLFAVIAEATPQFCKLDILPGLKTYEYYAQNQDLLSQGQFAQGIVGAYKDHFEYNESNIFETDSDLKTYDLPGGQKVEIKKFNPAFSLLIQQLGVAFQE